MKIYKQTSWACAVAIYGFIVLLLAMDVAFAADSDYSVDDGWQKKLAEKYDVDDEKDGARLDAITLVNKAEMEQKTKEFEEKDTDSSCDGTARAAQYVCDPLSAVLGHGEGAMLEMVLGQGGNIAMGMKNSGKSAYQQCKSAKNLAKVMGMIQGARAVACGVAQKKCSRRCDAVRDHLKEIEENPSKGPQGVDMSKVDLEELQKRARRSYNNCQDYERNFAMQLFQVMNYASTYFGAGQCQKETKLAESTPYPTPPPTKIDCKDAENLRTNPLCLCERSPRDPLCVGGPRPSQGPGVFTSVDDGPGSGFEPPPLPPGDGDGSGPVAGGPQGGGSGSSSKSGGVPQNGGGGPTNPFGGGGGAGARAGVEGSADPGSSGYNTGVITGASGGGTFAGYGKGGAAGEGRDGNGNLMKALKDKFNLKDALPDKDRLARGLAGMSAGAQADGITGANGPSIWEKVSRQYQKKKPELLAPR